jgi:hypothetical protein
MYTLRMPHPRLRAFIENYWFVFGAEGESADLRVEVFVDARPDLVFNFGVPYVRTVIGGESRSVASSNLDAQRLVPIRIEQHGAVRVPGVRFLLGGLAPFSQIDLGGVSGRTVDPVEVLGRAAAALEERLRAKHDPDAAATLLDEFFLEMLDRAPAATSSAARWRHSSTRSPTSRRWRPARASRRVSWNGCSRGTSASPRRPWRGCCDSNAPRRPSWPNRRSPSASSPSHPDISIRRISSAILGA